jgi:CheY-like chemotaxis protein
MPPELLSRIFEPFFTTKPVGKGTGLGLAAVWGTVLDHHGSLAVRSAPGAGTVFTLLLPLSEEQAPIGSDRPPEVRPGRGTILLIDDEPLVRESGRELLRTLGWEVVEACDGREGVEIFAREHRRIDLVLVDMEMPRLRGVDCLRELRVIDPQVRAVLCSGFARDAGAHELRAEGFLGQIAKLYRLSELDRVLEAALR